VVWLLRPFSPLAKHPGGVGAEATGGRGFHTFMHCVFILFLFIQLVL
jgi:hypothetical protein